MRYEGKVEIRASKEAIWDYITDPANPTEYFEGLVRWDVEGDQKTGLGARYAMRMRVGTAFLGGTIEVVEWDPGRDMAWTGVTGIDQRGRWRLRARTPAFTEVTFRYSTTVPGGIVARVAEMIGSRWVVNHFDKTLQNLKAHLEG